MAHADEAFIVLVKPVGWLSQPGKVQAPDVCSWARERAAPNALLVHRLDMETSGLMILARGRDAQRRLGEAFRRRRVDKSYEAIVAGIPPRASGEISLRQRLDVNDRPRQVVDWLLGRAALTRWRLIGRERVRDKACARLALAPATGRTHQLRLACAAPVEQGGLGCAIVGDSLYAPQDVADLAPRLLLHATAIAFDHPRSGRRVRFTSPAPF